MRVLIVDDKRRFRQMLRLWFIQQGHDVHDVDGGPETFQLLKNFKYDMVTLDLLLPHTSGMTMIDSIRQIHPGIRIIVISSEASPRVAVECIKAGADACLEKPVDFAAMKQELSRYAGYGSYSGLSQRLGVG